MRWGGVDDDDDVHDDGRVLAVVSINAFAWPNSCFQTYTQR